MYMYVYIYISVSSVYNQIQVYHYRRYVSFSSQTHEYIIITNNNYILTSM